MGQAVDTQIDSQADWFRMTAAETLNSLDVDSRVGLSAAEVARRTELYGSNRLDEVPRRPAWKRFLDQFKDLMIYILIAAGVISALVGDLKDPIVIAIVLLINATLGFIQENKADNALAALEEMLESTARVRRDGAVQEIPSTEIVPGDIVLMEAGDRVPADGRFVIAANTSVDESMLTGESVPTDKSNDPDTPAGSTDEVPLADRHSVAHMNTTVVRGRAELAVTATGMSTEMGRLADLISGADPKVTPLQEQIDQLGKRLAVIAFVAVVIVFIVALVQADELNQESISEALLTSVALAIAAIPEGLPAVVTVTLAVGVSRLAKRNAIVKRLASVETLGSTNVICSDKTGTLTLNQMTATRLETPGRSYTVDGLGYGTEGQIRIDGQPLDEAQLREVGVALSAGVLCNDSHLREVDGVTKLVGDPTEGALLVVAAKAGIDPEGLRHTFPRVDEVPFDSATKFMATLHAHPDDPKKSLLIVKGAPDVVSQHCSTITTTDGVQALDSSGVELLRTTNEGLGSEGLRVLALAVRDLPVPAHEYEGDLESELNGLSLIAFIGILDPARPEAIDAIAKCKDAGIKVKMITGDHPSTAGAIASAIGIEGRVVTGADLDAISDEDLPTEIQTIGACARVTPDHKVRVVKALQANGNIVAMTGDGVNDAASLKQAEIGVAMGITGTEVTKEAGDMILSDDNFATIVHAVEGGRATYDNIITFVRFQLSTNISAIATILIAQLAGFGTILNAIQILFVNIIADGPPAIALGVDPPKPDVMSRPPRQRDEVILSGERLARIMVSAAVITAGTLGLFMAFRNTDEKAALTMAFSSFVFFQLVNSFCVRSGNDTIFSRYSLSNRSLLIALVSVLAIQVAVVEVPFLQTVFETVSLSWSQWGWVLLTPLTLLVVEEIRKVIARARSASV
ncbi:MAG: HAD-IC family P-type ATPase [Microthrixaceae bacterium]